MAVVGCGALDRGRARHHHDRDGDIGLCAVAVRVADLDIAQMAKSSQP